MKASTIKHIIITSALVMGAFFIGKSAQLNHSIPTEDIACWYTNADGYITVELKDITHQLDNKANASYSYNKYYEKYKSWGFSDEDCKRYAESDTKKEVADGVQTFNYQCNSMSNSNGQSPFLSVFMYLGETTEYKKELAMIIEEFLNQRLLGLKNEVGVYVTQAFPKLLYVLEEDNIHENSTY